jgi:hypothetical protein
MLVSVSGAGALANVEAVLAARDARESDLVALEARVAVHRTPAVPTAA